MALRVYLAGRMTLLHDDRVVAQRDLPGTLSRGLLAALVLRRCPVRRSELADMLARDEVNGTTWDATLNSTLSRLRAQLGQLGLDGRAWLQAVDGTVEFCRPTTVIVDIEAAQAAIDHADVLWKSGAHDAAWSEATVAYAVAARPFLPGVQGLWAEHVQADLDSVRRRALVIIAESSILSGDVHQAVVVATRLVRDDELAELHHRLLIRAHLAAGDRARAKQALDRLGTLLRSELNVTPSLATLALLD